MSLTMKHFTLTACTIALLSACGGGSSNPMSTATPAPTATPAASTMLKGTAAAGAPLAGDVTVKDANGKTVTTPINADGSYSVDTAGLTPPFIIRAEGYVGGRSYVVHSAALASDLGGTVNVTPLTDLIIANVAGQLASSYFDNPNFAKLTPTTLASETAALKTKLQKVLTALGINDTIDLLRASFSADHTGLDAALDTLRISTDAATGISTITNIITNEAIQDDPHSTTDTTTLNDTSNLTAAIDDVKAVPAVLKAFTDAFATSLPTIASLQPLLTDGFLHDDENRAQFLADVTSDPFMIGMRFDNVVIDSLDVAAGKARVTFSAHNKDGSVEVINSFKLRKGGDGKWRLHGNQRVLSVDLQSHTVQSIRNGGAAIKKTGLEFWIDDLDSSNNGGTIDHATVTGPGLGAGLTYVPSFAQKGQFVLSGLSTAWYVMENDTALKSIPDNATYVMTFYDAANNVLKDANGTALQYEVLLPKRPYLNAELATLVFPTLTTPSLAQFATFSGGDVDLSGTVPATALGAWALVAYNTNASHYESVDADFTVANNAYKHSFTLTAPAQGETINFREIRIEYHDTNHRNVMTHFTFD
jgi:hypothetical protein